MDLEKRIAEATNSLFADGWVEEQIMGALKESIKKAVNDQFSYGGAGYGKIKEAVKASVEKSVSLVEPEYIPHLEIVLTEIMEQTITAEKKKLLENFRTLMTDNIPERKGGGRVIHLDDIFAFYMKYVSAHFETEGREVNTDDEPTYDPVRCNAWIENDDEKKGYFRSQYIRATLYLVTEGGQDENGSGCNFKIPLIKWDKDDKDWAIYDVPESIDFAQLYIADPMLVYLYKLKNGFVRIADTHCEFEEYAELDEKPECEWS